MLHRPGIGFARLCVLLAAAVPGCTDSRADFRPTPVCRAIVAGDLDQAARLLALGADPNAGQGCALVAAASRGHIELVRQLLDRGADPNRGASGDTAVALGGSTPLVSAMQSRQPAVVQLLLERGANARQDFEAFSIALNFGDTVLAALLLEAGADPGMRERADAVVYGFEGQRMVRVAPEELAPARIDDTARRLGCTLTSGATLLHEATQPGAPGGAGRDRIAILLIERGADPNATSPNGSTPLMHAAARGSREVVARLLAAGADRSARDRCGRSPLTHAGSADIAALLADDPA